MVSTDQRLKRVRRMMLELSPDHQFSEPIQLAILKWLGLLEQWNRKIDLTAARSEDELLDLMLADALVLHRGGSEFDRGSHWLDVGTGAGAPGLALAILDPSLRIDLVEPSSKRVAFLRHVIGSLRLTNVSVHATRLESITHLGADNVVSRATLSPPEWLLAGLRLTRQRLWFLLGREPWSPSEAVRVVYDRAYVWPLTGATRRVLAVTP